VSGAPGSDPEVTRRWAVERVEVLFNRGELDRVEEFVTPDFVNHEAWPGEADGSPLSLSEKGWPDRASRAAMRDRTTDRS
jgi:hypothetical protein